MINDGITGEVIKLPPSLKSLFKGVTKSVRKYYKAPSYENPFALEDYTNEVASLKLLSGYKNDLPFAIPQIIDHGLLLEGDKYIAFVDMAALDNVDTDTPADQSYDPEKTRRIGQALVHFHQLNISPKDQLKLKRDPIERLDAKLGRHLLRGVHSDRVDEARALLSELKGPKVLLHGDLHPQNTCLNTAGALSGALDFCYTGIGIKEIDFLYYAEDDNHLEAAIEGYMQNGGEKLNMNNLSLISRIAPTYLGVRNDLEQVKKIMTSKPVIPIPLNREHP